MAGGREKFNLTDRELAVMASSHSGAEFHTRLVSEILAKMGFEPGQLECGTARPLDDEIFYQMLRAGLACSSLHNDCSGKHAGMLGLALLKNYPIRGYSKHDHPLQSEMRQTVAHAAGIPVSDLQEGIDGCGVPTYRVPLSSMALAYANLALPEQQFWGDQSEHVRKVRDAMVGYPEYVGGEGRYETSLMRVTKGRLVAKLGAEASFCIGDCEQGLGFACKVHDGAMRVLPHVCTVILLKTGWMSEKEADCLRELYPSLVRNDHGNVVGRVEVSGV